MKLFYLLSIMLLISCTIYSSNHLLLSDYYPIADNNEWRYTAPEGWKDGDYISRIEESSDRFLSLINQMPLAYQGKLIEYFGGSLNGIKAYRHFDATKAAKLLFVKEGAVYYIGEESSNAVNYVLFEEPILWFNKEITIGDEVHEIRKFTRIYPDGKTADGTFRIDQKLSQFENQEVSFGQFENCLRIDFTTDWDMGGGMTARSENVYHHAKEVGVVNASARFIIKRDTVELINRLVVPDMKSFTLN